MNTGRLFQKLRTRSVVFLCLLFLGACFDYKETLVFYEDFSGYLELDYRVPMYPERDRSLIAFLPATKERVLARYRRFIRRGQIQIQGFRLEMQSVGLPSPTPQKAQTATSGDASLFRRFAHVRYRILFQDPQVLEAILPGQIRLRIHGRKALQIERRFPVTGGLSDKANRVVGGLYRVSRELLEDHAMRFQVRHADGLVLKSNRGRLNEAADLLWRLPLANSLYEKKEIYWRLSLAKKPTG